MISFIIPTLNEKNNIDLTVQKIEKSISEQESYEIIFVDDKSSDGTLLIMQEEKKNNLDIKIKIIKGEGKGKSRAVDVGVKNCIGDYCMILDADITVRVEDLDLFYNAIKNNNADLINGSRMIY